MQPSPIVTSSIIVVYSAKGRLTSAIVTDPTLIIDYTLYWLPTSSIQEAHYLTGILNSNTVNFLNQNLIGNRGANDPFQYLPIPRYNPDYPLHNAISDLSSQISEFTQYLLPTFPKPKDASNSTQHYRRLILKKLSILHEAQTLESQVTDLFRSADIPSSASLLKLLKSAPYFHKTPKRYTQLYTPSYYRQHGLIPTSDNNLIPYSSQSFKPSLPQSFQCLHSPNCNRQFPLSLEGFSAHLRTVKHPLTPPIISHSNLK